VEKNKAANAVQPRTRGFKQTNSKRKVTKMPAKKKSAKSARKSAKMRDLRPSKDAKGGRSDLRPGYQGGRGSRKTLL
jgi:hypothetical protein